MKVIAFSLFLIGFVTLYAGVIQGTIKVRNTGSDPGLVSCMLISDNFEHRYEFLPNSEGFFELRIPNEKPFKGSLLISGSSTFQIQISKLQVGVNDTVTLNEIPIINSFRKKLPKGAICGNFAPLKRQIPKKQKVKINGKRRVLKRNWSEQRYDLIL